MNERSSRDSRPPRRPGARSALAEAVLRTVAAYAFAGWVYIALNAVVHPATLSLPLTHLAPWPREDTFGAACFGISFSATLLRHILGARKDVD